MKKTEEMIVKQTCANVVNERNKFLNLIIGMVCVGFSWGMGGTWWLEERNAKTKQ